MTDAKLPEWPDRYKTDVMLKMFPDNKIIQASAIADYAQAESAYWSARCRLLYAALHQIHIGDDQPEARLYDRVAEALRDCGPLPEHRT